MEKKRSKKEAQEKATAERVVASLSEVAEVGASRLDLNARIKEVPAVVQEDDEDEVPPSNTEELTQTPFKSETCLLR